jgi:hypothetical protein
VQKLSVAEGIWNKVAGQPSINCSAPRALSIDGGMNMKMLLSLGCMALALAACASSARYHEASGDAGAGYREQMLESNRYRIEYQTNDNRLGRAQDYVLLRAAELTLENGYSTFSVVNRSSDLGAIDRPQLAVAFQRDVAFTRSCGLLKCRTEATPVYTSAIVDASTSRPFAVASLEILMSNSPADGRSEAYSAASVIRNIPRG